MLRVNKLGLLFLESDPFVLTVIELAYIVMIAVYQVNATHEL